MRKKEGRKGRWEGERKEGRKKEKEGKIKKKTKLSILLEFWQ